MSDVQHDISTFLSRYGEGRISADRIDDFIEAWHNSGDEETRSLAAFLGMSDDEYAVWVMSHAALPAILAARRERRPLADAVAEYLAELRRCQPVNRPAIHALSHWLRQSRA